MKNNYAPNNFFSLIITCCLVMFSFSAISQTTFYVVEDATGNGTSWGEASGDLQLMINTANAGDEIWVAAGTYKPNRKPIDLDVITPNDRQNAFSLKPGVAIYGGFNGTETDATQRDWFVNETILSGDYNDDDVVTGSGSTLTITNNGENALHVVVSVADGGNSPAVLDGFTIRGGNANDSNLGMTVQGQTVNGRVGAGIYNTSASPILRNLNITGNAVTFLGAGVYTTGQQNSDLTITNSSIHKNTNLGTGFSFGGGIVADANTNLSLLNVSLTGNRGHRGGGLVIVGASGSNTSIILLTNVTVSDNYAGQHGGGISLSGANTTFNMHNSVVYGNTSVGVDNFHIGTATATAGIANSLIEGSGGSSNWDTLLGGTGTAVDLGNNIDEDPLFADPEEGDFSLTENSAAINAGSNTLYTDAGGDLEEDNDVVGNTRVVNDIIDMGAYEFPGGTPVCSIVCPGSISVSIPASQTTAIVNYDVTFDCDDAEGVTLELVEGFASGSEFPIGETLVTYQLVYEDEILDSCTFTVVVTQNDPVCVIVCPMDITVDIPASQTTATVDYNVVFGCDNTEGVTLELVEGLASGSEFPIGDTEVTYELVYEGEVLDTCTFTVTVEQNDPLCTLLCPDDIYVTVPEGETGAEVEYEIDFDCDNADGVTLVMVEGLASGATFPLGETTVVYNLVFEGEVLDTCSFTVEVEEVLNVSNPTNPEFQIYPNPVSDILNIQGVNVITSVAVFDILGNIVINQNTNNQNISLDVSALSTGVYLVKITANDITHTARLIKK